jgi:hypothetical protein
MKERTIAGVIVSLIALIGVIVASRSTDVIFITSAVGFFGICIAYAEWCERL